MILLTVIATKNVKLVLVERRSVVFDLGRLHALPAVERLVGVFGRVLTHEDPLKLLLLRSVAVYNRIIWRIVAMLTIGHIFILLL